MSDKERIAALEARVEALEKRAERALVHFTVDPGSILRDLAKRPEPPRRLTFADRRLERAAKRIEEHG